MHKVIRQAKDLPKEWDDLCHDNIYLSRHFMTFMDQVNPCRQSYHLFYKGERLYAGFMMFERKFNPLIFTNRYRVKIPMKFLYLPLSVSHPSVVFSEDMEEMTRVLRKMRGLKIIINVDETINIKGFSKGHYLPICLLKNRWKSFEEYLSSMRSSYRRRINQALKKGADIAYEYLEDNKQFTDEMYHLYEQVFDHSQYSLEKLTREFFQNDISRILLLKIKGKVEAFIQIIEDSVNNMLIFEFCGYNYELAHEYDIYHNMLIKITEYGINHGFDTIQFGQTAYDAKLKFGADMYYNYFLMSHSNPLINYLISKKIDWIQYKVTDYDFHVFDK